MHDTLDQDQLPMKLLLPADDAPVTHDVAALVAYLHDNQKTIKSMMKSIEYLKTLTDYLTHQVKSLERKLGTTPNPSPKNEDQKSALKKPETRQTSSINAAKPQAVWVKCNIPPWKGTTPPDNPNKKCKWQQQTWRYCTKCLQHSSWVTDHCTKTHTPTLGKAVLARFLKKKEQIKKELLCNPKRQKQAPASSSTTPATTVAALAISHESSIASCETLQQCYDNAAANLNTLHVNWNIQTTGSDSPN